MAELSESEIITKLNNIDTQIAALVTAYTAGTGAAFTDYTIGNKTIHGSQQFEQLKEMRKMYQDLLNAVPKVIVRHHQYEKEKYTGNDLSEDVGDES